MSFVLHWCLRLLYMSEKHKQKKIKSETSEAQKMLCFNYLCKRKKVDDRSDNDCEIREITEFFEKTQINILRQFGRSIDICVLGCRFFPSFDRLFDFGWNALASSCCGRYILNRTKRNTVVDRCASINRNALNAKCKERSKHTHERKKTSSERKK